MNPYDVFPRRNLPPEAEDWGRVVEDRIIAQEAEMLGLGGDVSGQNRTTASTTESLARQLENLEAVYKEIPKPRQATTTNANFGLSSGWNTVASVNISNPNATRVDVMAASSGQLISTTSSGNIELRGRLLINGGSASPVIDGYWYNTSSRWVNLVLPSFAWTINAGAGFTVDFQVNPTAASSWSANTGSEVALSVFATFSG